MILAAAVEAATSQAAMALRSLWASVLPGWRAGAGSGGERMTRNITETKCFTLVGGAAPERTRPRVSRAMVQTATRQILTTFRHETADSEQVRTPTAPEPARIFSNRSGVGHSIPPASTTYFPPTISAEGNQSPALR